MSATIPADMLQRLMNIAAQQKGVNDASTLMLFAEVQRIIEEARRAIDPEAVAWLQPVQDR